MEENNIYRTSDFNQAVFLLAKGLEFRGVEDGMPGLNRCTFRLFIPNEIDIAGLLSLWSGTETEFIRTILYRNKTLKAELKRHFSSQS